MMEDRKTLFIKDTNGRELEAELLTILQINGIEYAVYSVDKDDYTSDVYVARVIKDQNGNDSFVSIENEEEKNKVFQVIDKMINES